MIPQQFIDELNRDADLVGLIGRHVKLTKKGNSFVGLCPFHSEKTGSFNVVPEKGFYHCFGCGVSGTALSFLMRFAYGGEFLPAVEDLARQLGREVPSSGGSPGDAKRRRLAEEMMERIQNFYSLSLRRSRKPVEYLKEQRGISKQTAMRYGMGFAPRGGGLEQALGGDLDEGMLLYAGMLKKREGRRGTYPYFRERITIPIHNSGGRVAGFGARSLDGSEPKYLNSPQTALFDKGRLVYGLQLATPAIKEEGFALIVEGYMDVIVLAEHGLANAVATMGTAATAQQMRSILARTDSCIFCFDGDDAGRRAAAKALGNCMPALADGKELRFAFLPQGEDPDSFVRTKGAEALRKLLGEALELSGMLVNPPRPEGEELSEAQKVRQWHGAAELIERMDRERAPLLKELLYTKLAEASGIEVGSLKEAAESLKSSQPPERASAEEQEAPSSGRRMRDHELFRLLVCLAFDPSLVDELDGVQLSQPNKRDANLCETVIAHLRDRKKSGEEADVRIYLGRKGLSGLTRQISDSVNKKRGKGFDLKKEMSVIIETMKSKNKRKEAEERIRRSVRDQQGAD